MKRIISLFLCVILCISVFMTTASAATTYTDYTWDLSSEHKNVSYADVVYDGEIVGYGCINYTINSILYLVILSYEVETEYQNYGLPRELGTNNGINVTVYAYIEDGSTSVSDKYSWSDSDYSGGNSLGWITALANIGKSQPTYLTGYVTLKTSSGSSTYGYRVNK